MSNYHPVVMNFSCLSIRKKGWIGFTFFIVGLASLAFSQLEFSEEKHSTSSELREGIDFLVSLLDKKTDKIDSSINNFSFNKEQRKAFGGSSSNMNKDEIQESLAMLENGWSEKSQSLLSSNKLLKDNLQNIKGIYADILDTYAGRIDDAKSTLKTLHKNLSLANDEATGIEKASIIAIEEIQYNLELLNRKGPQISNNNSIIPGSNDLAANFNSPSSRIASLINANSAIPLDTKPPSISPNVMAAQLDMARKNIDSLKANLDESKSLLDKLQKDKDLLKDNYASGKSASNIIGDELGRLRNELAEAREELSETRKQMLVEQEKSASVVKTISSELDRTRNELVSARAEVNQVQDKDNSLTSINDDLSSIKKTLEIIAQDESQDTDSDNLDEISKQLESTLSEIALLQGRPGVPNPPSPQDQNIELKKSNELVEKLLIDLSSAKEELVDALAENRETRKNLNNKIVSLEDELKSTNLELIKTVRGYDEAKLEMTKREFEFADTIKKLEEEAQVAQNALSQASLGKLPAIPFIEEMEKNLVDSEKRIEALSVKFDSEKEKAAEVIDGLQVELENANIRQKRAMEQLGRRELELKGKDEELAQVKNQNKTLEEELEVVKIISGQLQDLNTVLEETKKAQNLNLINTDQAVLSLRDELNQARVELVYEREEKEKMVADANLKIASLEGQLSKFKDKLRDEQESLVQQTMESKDLIFDLKSELDAAREEIARMKTVGATESLETKTAVSQLQEALGTIRVLKESLEESEQANLELDNLRNELADSMDRQIAQVKRDEEQKAKLQQKISDLEAEILIFRNNESADAVKTKNLISDLNEKLKKSEQEIGILNNRLEASEDGGLSSVILLQEELAREQDLTQDLQSRIKTLLEQNATAAQNIEGVSKNPSAEEIPQATALEAKLFDALEEIKALHSKVANPKANDNNFDTEMVLSLEKSLAKAEASFSNLEEELLKEKSINKQTRIDLEAANAKLIRLESIYEQNEDGANISDDLIDSLAQAEQTASILSDELERQKEANQKLVRNLELEKQKLASFNNTDTVKQSMPYLNNQVIVDLEDSLAASESKVLSLEKALVAEKNKNQDLATDIENISKNLASKDLTGGDDNATVIENYFSKISFLEQNLVDALEQLEVLEDKNSINNDEGKEVIEELENSLSQSELTILQLQDKLASLEASNLNDANASNFQAIVTADNELIEMEEALLSAQMEVEMLKKKNEDEIQNRLGLERKLDNAIAKLESVDLGKAEDNSSAPNLDFLNLKNELSAKENEISKLDKELAEAIELLNEKEAELEIAKALSNLPAEDSNNSDEIANLKLQLASLQDELKQAYSENNKTENSDEISLMKEKLQQAVTDSFELQTELEETKNRLLAVEGSQNSIPQLRKQFEELLSQSQSNESKAIAEIESLTVALKNSESLRKELEVLIDEFQEIDEDNRNLANDPKIIKLQQEMLFLQEGLRQAREYDDPEVADLKKKLEFQTKENESLNEEFKNAMKDFVRIKDQVEMFEMENERLKNQAIAEVKSGAEKELIGLRNEVAGLKDQNSFLKLDLQGRDRRLSDMRDQLIRSQNNANFSSPQANDSAELRGKIIRLEGDLQASRDSQLNQQRIADRLNQELTQSRDRIATLEQSLRNGSNQIRTIPVPQPVPSLQPSPITSALSNSQKIELDNLRQQNQRLQEQLASATASTDRNLFDQRIRELNQKNLTAQVQLDQERRRSLGLEKELEEARDIKRGIIEKGESANLKVGLLNDELENAQNRISSLEKALIAAREAIRILRNGGNDRSTINVSLGSPANSGTISNRRINLPLRAPSRQFGSFNERTPSSFSLNPSGSITTPKVNRVPIGNASLKVSAQVQFLNNRNRPASFTEFFLVENSLDEIAANARINLPSNQGISSFSELWARAIQRGYRFPGVAANIRNALASSSLSRIKTNSVGEATLSNVQPGDYFLVGTSTLGQVGVVWSKPISIKTGENIMSLSLKDASWAE